MRRLLFGLAGLLLAAAGQAQAQAPCETDARLDWRVEGRFTLFNRTTAGQAAGDALLDDLAKHRRPDGSVSMVEAYDTTIRHLAGPGAGPARLFESTFYDKASERYLAVADGREFLSPSHRTIRLSAPAVAGDCVWRAPGEPAQRGACSESVAVRVPATGLTKLIVDLPDGGFAQACVEIRDTLILAMGDSFAAGEGNPDRPTDWSELSAPKARLARGFRWMRDDELLPKTASASWWDDTCHRSLLSQHAQAALALAAADRHGTVTFISFACSGATVLDGYVAPRISTPGGKRATPGKGSKGEWTSRAYQVSQINQAVDFLCKDASPAYQLIAIPGPRRYWRKLNDKTTLEAREQRQTAEQVAVRTCSEWRDRPDIVLNSLGGNDIGFSGVAAWAVLPPAGRQPLSALWAVNAVAETSRNPGMGIVCPLAISGQLRCKWLLGSEVTAEELVAQDLGPLLALGAEAFEVSGLGGQARAKVQSLYPSILRDAAGERCGREWTRPFILDGHTRKSDPNLKKQRESWMAQVAKIPLVSLDGWSLGFADIADHPECAEPQPAAIDTREGCVLEARIWSRLNATVDTTMRGRGWTTVKTAGGTAAHGFCAWDRPDESWESYRAAFGFPRWTGQAWDQAYPDPTEWRPYEKRARWFRTANDSALTQYASGEGGADEALSGTIHPTAQGHAAMADKIVESLR